MKLIPNMDIEGTSGIKDLKYKCSLCGKKTKAGYTPETQTDEEFDVSGDRLGPVESWWICEDCVEGLCQDPNVWFERVKERELRKEK